MNRGRLTWSQDNIDLRNVWEHVLKRFHEEAMKTIATPKMQDLAQANRDLGELSSCGLQLGLARECMEGCNMVEVLRCERRCIQVENVHCRIGDHAVLEIDHRIGLLGLVTRFPVGVEDARNLVSLIV